MNTPLVTIVVISYNQAKYIVENLDSIKAQTYTNIELIVADDASTDDSVEVFDNWLAKKKYSAKKNYHTNNTGLATVLNECIEIATGKYIKLIAADDYLHPEAIEKCVAKLEELGDEYGMVFTDIFTINNNSEQINDLANYNELGGVDPYVFRNELIKGNRIAALTVLLRLEALKATGKYDTKFIIEDYFRWLKINEKYLIAYIPFKLAYYRLHETNITRLRKERIQEEDILLKLMFDKKGIVRNKVNNFFKIAFLNNLKLDRNTIKYYHKYPFKIKRLSLAYRYNLPIMVYKIINKYL